VVDLLARGAGADRLGQLARLKQLLLKNMLKPKKINNEE
jgi:hypothetical protein